MTWDLPLGTTTLHAALWPVLVALAGALLALLAYLWMRRALAGTNPDGARWWRTLIGLAPPAIFLPVVGIPDRLAWALVLPVGVDLALAVAGGLLAGRALDGLLVHEAGSPERARVLGLARAAWIGGLIAQAALVHAGVLLGVGEPPGLALPAPGLVQVGRTTTLVPQVVPRGERRPRSMRWTPVPLVVQGDEVGGRYVVLQAKPAGVPWISATERAWIRVVEERGDARLPLAVGNRWAYRVVTTSHIGGIIGMFDGSSRWERAAEMRVEGVAEIAGGGVRVFRIRITGDATDGAVLEAQVYAADGQLFVVDDQGVSSPLFTRSPKGDGFAPIFGACGCAEVGSLRGPTRCVEEKPARRGSKVPLGILTLGLVSPESSAPVWILRDTSAGPTGAPAVARADVVSGCDPAKPAPVSIDPGEDTPPAERPTWRESLAAAPPWARGIESLGFKEARALFNEATPLPAGDAALLVCKVTYYERRGFNLFAGPDLDVTLRIGEVGLIEHANPGDEYSAYVTSGPISLRGGSCVSAHLVQRRASDGDEDLGVVEATVQRERPASAEDGPRSIACRGIDRAAVEVAFTTALARLDGWLDEYAGSLHPTLEGDDLGAKFGAAREALARAAALVGWADPRVARRAAWERRIEDSFAGMAALLVRELSARKQDEVLWKPTLGPPLALRAQGFACSAALQQAYAAADMELGAGSLARWGCVLEIAVENRGDDEASVDVKMLRSSKAPPMWLALDSGRTMKLRAIEIVSGRVREKGPRRHVPAHARATMILVPMGAIDPTKVDAVMVLGSPPDVLSVPRAR